MKKYFIYENEQFSGPFDALAIIKKIRNRQLTGEEWVRDEENKDEQIKNIPIFAEIIADNHDSSVTGDNNYRRLEFIPLIRAGLKFVALNQMALALSGLAILAFIIFGFTLSGIPLIGFVLANALSYVAFSAFLFYILKYSRGQYINFSYLKDRLKVHFKNLFMAGLFSTLLLSITLLLTFKISPLFLLLIIPGLFVFALFVFAPLLILDQDKNYNSALTESYQNIMKRGLDDIGIVFGMVVINFVATLAALAPLVFSLPVTGQAIINIYEEIFHS